MRELSVDEILDGIREHNTVVLEHIYQTYYDQIRYLVISNSGTQNDAEDIYQEALIVIYRKLKAGELEIENCSFNTYLYSVCKLLWLKQLEKKRIRPDELAEQENLSDFEQEDLLKVYEKSEKYKLFQKHFSRLQSDCKRVLELTLEKYSLREIANKMGYGSEKYAKKKKYLCKERLIESIKKDPKYTELT